MLVCFHFITAPSSAPLLAGAIQRIHEERSVSELFDGQHENSEK